MQKKETLRVGDSYRTHPDSHVDGGVVVVVEYLDGRKNVEYDKVKNPKAFIAAIWRNHPEGVIGKAYVNTEEPT